MPQMPYDISSGIAEAVLIAGGLFVILDMVLFILWIFSHYRESQGKPPLFSASWSLLDVFVAAQEIIALTLFGTILIAFALSQSDKSQNIQQMLSGGGSQSITLIIASAILQNLVTLAIVFGYVKFRYRINLLNFCLGEKPLKGILIGILTAIPLIALVNVPDMLGWSQHWLHALDRTKTGQIFQTLQESMDATWMVKGLVHTKIGFWEALITVGFIAPIGEECFFRGFLFNAIWHRFGLTAGILVSGLLFAAVHMQIVNFIPMVLMGVVMGATYYKTKTLFSTITIHALNNSLMVVLLAFAPNLVK